MRLARGVLLLAVLSGAARAECALHRAALLPITLWQDKLFVPVSINGSPRMMFIDTGAGITTLSSATAAALNLPRDYDHTTDAFGVGGVESHLTIVHTRALSLGGIDVLGRAFPVAGFAQAMADGTPVGGLIGVDVLSRYDIEIDIRHRLLGLWDAAGCTEVAPDWSGRVGSAKLDVAPSRLASVPVRVDGVSVNLVIDTGSPDLLLSTRAAARAGAVPEELEEGRTMRGHGVNDRGFDAWLHVFSRLDVADQVFGDVRVAVVSSGRVQSGDGLLGLAFFKRGRVWVSYATERLFMERVEEER